MPKSFQWITLLLIESIYFAGIRVKGPHTSVWIIPSNSIGPLGSTSKFQIHRTSEKHIQTLNHRTPRKHVQISNHRTSEKHVQTSNHWTSKKHDKFQIHRTFGKHVQTSNHQTFGKHVQISNPSNLSIHRTSGKHVQNSISMDLWEARPNFESIRPLGSMSKFQIHQTF